MSQKKREELEALAAKIKGEAIKDVYLAIKGAGLKYGGTVIGVREEQKNEKYWSGSYEDYWGLSLILEGDDEVIVEVEVYTGKPCQGI